MTHIVALGSILIILALVPALAWRRYRQSRRTPQDRRRLIGGLLVCGLMGAFLAATNFIHGDRLPGWVSYLGDLTFALAIIGIAMIWNGDASANDEAGRERSGEG